MEKIIWLKTDLSIIILMAMSVHLTQAIIMMFTVNGNGAIDIHSLLDWIPLDYAPAILISTVGFAFIGLLNLDLDWYIRLAFFIPQQALITLSVSGVLVSVYEGSYADGTMKPGVHIFLDQIWLIAYLFTHAYAVIRRSIQ